MRITGGVWASRAVAGPGREGGVRPTPDALREQAFAVLSPHLAGCRFLDLFAGTGVVSLEALSRGAAQAVLVETSRTARTVIERNMASLQLARGERWEVLALPAVRAVAALASRGFVADLVWCDPPFSGFHAGPEALGAAARRGILAPGARVVMEVPPREDGAVPGFRRVRVLRGAVLLEVEAAPTS